MSVAFQVIQTLLAAEEAKDVGGEKGRMLMVRGSKTLLEGYSVELGPWFLFDTKGKTKILHQAKILHLTFFFFCSSSVISKYRL